MIRELAGVGTPELAAPLDNLPAAGPDLSNITVRNPERVSAGRCLSVCLRLAAACAFLTLLRAAARWLSLANGTLRQP